MVDKNKDKKGRFIRGNVPINLRDPKTGKFTSRKHQDISAVEQRVDELLKIKEKTAAEKPDISFEKYIDALLGL